MNVEAYFNKLTKLARTFEATLDKETYNALAKHLQDAPQGCFREVYQIVDSREYADWSAAE
jgi:hypothetical protein